MRQFGIELECVGMMPIEFAKIIRNHSHCCAEHGTFKKSGHLNLCVLPSHNRYRIKNDTSIGIGFELASLVYNTGVMSLFQLDITRIVELVRWAGCSTNKFCGLHVHVSFSKYRLKRFDRLHAIKFWKTVSVPPNFQPKKERVKYCQQPPHNKSKYSCLNFSHSRYPTIEFRHFNCCLNTRYIMRAVRFSLETADKLDEYLLVNKLYDPTQKSHWPFVQGQAIELV